jgi:hypothetical protein
MAFTLPDGGNWKTANPNGAGQQRQPGTFYANGNPAGGGYYSPTGTGAGLPGFPTNPGTQGMVDQYQAWINSQQAANNSSYLGNSGIAGLVRDSQITDLRRGAETDLARLAEQRFRDVDLARAGLDNQNTLAGSVWDTMNQQFGLDMNNINRQMSNLDAQITADREYTGTLNNQVSGAMGRRGQELASQREYINWQKSNLGTIQEFVNRGFNIGNQQAQDAFTGVRENATLQRDSTLRTAEDEAVARGANLSRGYGQVVGEIGQQYTNTLNQATRERTTTLDQLGLTRDRGNNEITTARRGYDYNLTQADQNYNEQIANLQAQYDSIQYQQGNRERDYGSNRGDLQYGADTRRNRHEGDVANYNYEAGNRDIASQQIDSIAREYGLREQDVNGALQSATQRIGLDYNNTMNQLAQQLNSGNAQLQQQAQNFLQQLMAQA